MCLKRSIIWLFVITSFFSCFEDNDDTPVYNQIDDVFIVTCPEPPIEIMSNQEKESVLRGEKVLNYFNIVQIKEDLYYMYYEAFKAEIEDLKQSVCFAYSNDGINWIRHFPDSEDNNNVVIPTNIMGVHVIQVPDETFPYRMFGVRKYGNQYGIYMLKSKDGFSFSDEKCILSSFLYNYHYDTQNVAIVEGKYLKMYIRIWKENHSNRKVGVAYFDFNGDLRRTPMVLKDDYLYNSAASKLNSDYDLLFPTYFNDLHTESDEAYVKALLVKEYDSKELYCNFNDWITIDEPWVMVSPGIITIKGEKYISYYTNSWSHNSTMPNKGKSSYKIIKININ